MATLLIDGEILKYSPHGGISRIFNSILPIMALAAPELDLIYRVPSIVDYIPPQLQQHPRLQIFEDWFPPLPPVIQKRLDPLSWRVNQHRIKRISADVFIPTYYTPSPTPTARTILTVYDLIDFALFAGASGNPPGFVERLRNSIETADHLVAISETTKQDIIKFMGVAPEHITVMPLAPAHIFTEQEKPGPDEIDAFRRQHFIDRPYWLYVGSRAHYKNFDTLLKAWAILAKSNESDMALVAAGGRPQGYMEYPIYAHQMHLVVENNLEKRLHILEGIKDDTLRLAYAGAHAYVFPSLYEGFSITPLEAMASGIPVVVSDIPVHREVCGDAAVYFDPHSAQDMARAMNMTLDQSTRQSFIEKGRAHVQQYSWEKSAQIMLDVCRRHLER